MVKCTERGLVVKQPGVLSKVQTPDTDSCLFGGGGLFLKMKKNVGHSEKNIFNKRFQGANSELNSLYFPRKTP